MSFKVKTKKPGDMIRSEDWNEAMDEIARLEGAKLSLEGGEISGPLFISSTKEAKNGSSLLFEAEEDGALISVGDTKALSINENGGIGIGMSNPHGGLSVNGPVVRKFWVSTGLQADGRDSGLIEGRVLTFTKYHKDSAIRIGYHDCFRVNAVAGNAGSGRWEILVDNVPPPGGRIFQDFHDYTGGNSDNHHPASIVGYAQGLEVGQHTITVNLGDVEAHESNHKDRYTGWRNSRWTIEAEEVWIQE